MIERTQEERTIISIKVLSVMTEEALTLHSKGHSEAAKVILDYLVDADEESLVILYDAIQAVR